jgi:hypothetical protein
MTDHAIKPAPDPLLADFLLAIHFAWALWMVTGVALALAGFRWPRLWRWRTFRIVHLIGSLGTATVPIWANGVCPLTTWEWDLRATAGLGSPVQAEPFLRHWMREILFIDVSPVALSIIAALGATATLAIFVRHPPWRQKRPRPPSVSVRGRCE